MHKTTAEAKRLKRNIALAIWREKNRERIQSTQRKYYEANRKVCAERVRACYAQNPMYYQLKIAEWKAANNDRVQALRRKRYAENPGVEIVRVRMRQKRIKSVPAWVTQAGIAEINGIYRFCNIFKGFEVDHIIPLNGKQVSGLHVPSNLQVLTVRANRQKGAAFKDS